MFPLDYKEPYIEANGSRSTLGRKFDEAGTDVAEVKAALDDEISVRAALGAHNRLALTLAEIKTLNTTGTWADNVYTESDLTITINTDSSGFVNNIVLNGTTTASVTFELARDTVLTAGSYILSSQTKAPVNFYFSLETPNVVCNLSQTTSTAFTQTGSTIHRVYLNVGSGRTLSSFKVEPMIRYADDTDSTYQPYAATNLELSTVNTATDSGITAIWGNHRCRVNVAVKGQSYEWTGEAWASIGSLPTGCPKPASDVEFVVMTYPYSNTQIGYIGAVANSGTVRVFTKATTNNVQQVFGGVEYYY